MPTGKRDPYYNDPERRNDFFDMVEEVEKAKRPIKWVCVCGNEAEGNVLTGWDDSGWAGVVICSVCKRSMQQEEVRDDNK